MAVTLVNTSTGSTPELSSVGTFGNVNLPAGMQQNDYVLVYAACDNPSGNTMSTNSAGWTQLAVNQAGDPSLIILRKFMPATPDTVISINTSTGGAPVGVICRAYRGVDTGTPEDVTIVAANAATGMPNPPSVDPVTADAAIVIMGALDDILVTATAPANYGNLVQFQAGAAAGNTCALMTADRFPTGHAIEDPAAFGGGGSGVWRAHTLALRPGAVTPKSLVPPRMSPAMRALLVQ